MKSRLIGVITVKNENAVQSFSYNKYLPIGDPKISCENLDRWNIDEIFLNIIDRNIFSEKGPDIDLLKKVSSYGLSTPLTYSGGIVNKSQALDVLRSGADRICVDYLVHQNPHEIINISKAIGKQSLVISLPLIFYKNKFFWYDYKNNIKKEIERFPYFLLDYVSELLITDVNNEGQKNSFNTKIIKFCKKRIKCSLIFFGGISETKQIKKIAKTFPNDSIAIGNMLNYKELASKIIKTNLKNQKIFR
jgi:cyclase